MPHKFHLYLIIKLVQQQLTEVKSFCMQFEKEDVGYCRKLTGVRETACEMTSHWCVVAGPVSVNKTNVYYSDRHFKLIKQSKTALGSN